MNERIKLLAEQAEQYADDTINSDPAKYDKPGQVKVWRELMQAKLAELILLECNMALQPILRDMISRGKACDLINKHFGVE